MFVIVGIGAAQMFVLGMIGEYLGRLYMESKHRPLYIIAEVVGEARAGARLGYRADSNASKETPGGIGTRPTK
jgi:dolichol-phosphate mannosyltransferase